VQGVGALGGCAQSADDGVAGLVVGVQVVALGRDLDADPRADVPQSSTVRTTRSLAQDRFLQSEWQIPAQPAQLGVRIDSETGSSCLPLCPGTANSGEINPCQTPTMSADRT